MALASIIRCMLFNAVIVVVVRANPPNNKEKVIPEVKISTSNCYYDNVEYKAGERFKPSPCTFCFCDDHGSGLYYCAEMACIPPPCYDAVFEPDQCCATCPNGPNCLAEGTVLQMGENITFNDGTTCSCLDAPWGNAIALCRLPPPEILY